MSGSETSEHHSDLRDAARAVLAAHGAAGQSQEVDLDEALWEKVEELGFTSLTVPVELGGAGGDLLDAAVVVREFATAALPLAEAAFLVGPLLEAAGISLPAGPITAAATVDAALARADDGGWLLSGVLRRVPWLAGSRHVVVLLRRDGRDSVALVPTGGAGFRDTPGRNVAGEPRSTVVLDRVRVTAVADLADPGWSLRFELLGAAARAVQMAGAAAATLAATHEFVHVRHQFGRPLVAFQAVQHQLARLAADVVTIEVSSEAAVLALRRRDPQAELIVAAAKGEASSLARPIGAASHQAHGAIGFTIEHSLGTLTKRLWAWRDEHGNELHWWDRIADLAAERDGDVWSLVTGTTPVCP